MSRTPNDDRSDGMNPNNPAQWANAANHLNQVGSEDQDDCSTVSNADCNFWRPAEPIFQHPWPEKPIKNVFLVMLIDKGQHASRVGHNVETFDLAEAKKGVEQLWQKKKGYLYICLLHGSTVLCEHRRREIPTYAKNSLKEAECFIAVVRRSSNCSETFHSHLQNIPLTVSMNGLLGKGFRSDTGGAKR